MVEPNSVSSYTQHFKYIYAAKQQNTGQQMKTKTIAEDLNKTYFTKRYMITGLSSKTEFGDLQLKV